MQSSERQGVSIVSYVFESMGFAFREQPIEDFGIDAIVEERESKSKLTGKLVGVQIKSGTSYFKNIKENKVTFWGKLKHYDYWINYSLPVILVLCDPENRLCIYEVISSDKIVKTEKNWKIEIDLDNKLQEAAPRLRMLNNAQTEYHKRLSTLAFAKGLMELAEEEKLVVEVREWINKCSGKGDFIIMKENDAGEVKELFGKTIFGFGIRPYEEVLPEVFPWANLVLDEEYYEMHGDQEYIQYKKQQNLDIYPYQNSACEVDWYRFRPILNEIGKSFMKLDSFLREGKMYNIEFGNRS